MSKPTTASLTKLQKLYDEGKLSESMAEHFLKVKAEMQEKLKSGELNRWGTVNTKSNDADSSESDDSYSDSSSDDEESVSKVHSSDDAPASVRTLLPPPSAPKPLLPPPPPPSTTASVPIPQKRSAKDVDDETDILLRDTPLNANDLAALLDEAELKKKRKVIDGFDQREITNSTEESAGPSNGHDRPTMDISAILNPDGEDLDDIFDQMMDEMDSEEDAS